MESAVRMTAFMVLLLTGTAIAQDEGTKRLLTREQLTGTWGGVRDRWEERGFTISFDITHVFQVVADGGFDVPLFRQVSDESDTGNTVSGDLKLTFDTEKLGLWHGGEFSLRGEARAGRSVLQRAGSVSA